METKEAQQAATRKVPFDVDVGMQRIAAAIAPFPAAALFALAEEGYNSVFEQLVACMISIRTRDETTLVVARQLFGRARTPAQIAALAPADLDDLIHASTFHESKTPQIQAIARQAVARYRGQLPCDYDVLTGFRGVGAKCANLVLGIACGQARISVDVHVHRVTNRWGYVATRAPEQTLAALEAKLPDRYWVAINRLLVPFGKHICTGTRPRCSTCPVLAMCRQIGVTAHR